LLCLQRHHRRHDEKGEIEIEGAPVKGPTASSNAASTAEQRDKSYPLSSETNEGIPLV